METHDGTVRTGTVQARNDHLTAWSAGLNFNRVAELLGVPEADLRYVNDAYVERRMSLLDGHARILLTQVDADSDRLQNIIDIARHRLAGGDDQRRQAGQRSAAMIAGRALMFARAVNDEKDRDQLLANCDKLNWPDLLRAQLAPAFAQDPREMLVLLSRCAHPQPNPFEHI